MKSPLSVLSIILAGTVSFPPLVRAAKSPELIAAEKRSSECMETKEGRQYHNKFFKVMESTLNVAMEGCLERTPDTKDDQHPAEFVFFISADGRLKRLVYSTDIPFGRCVGPKLRLVNSFPRPPGDNWAVLVGLGNEYHRLNGRPILENPLQTRGLVETTGLRKEFVPYIAKARATYPAAKKRFVAGLPAGYRFYVQLPLYGANDTRERCFVFVENIKNGRITGTIDRVTVLQNYKPGQRITFPESDIDNWLIFHPDGTEEGNYVGRSLDRYKPQ